jgi:hypothetical protein
MSKLSQHNHQPDEDGDLPSKCVWLTVMFSSIAPMVFLAGKFFAHGGDSIRGGQTMLMLIALAVNPVLCILSCYHLLARPDRLKLIQILVAILLGTFMAVINILIGLFGGCACSGLLA